MAILERLGMNGTILAQIISFLVLLYLLRRYVYGPLVQIMEARRQQIATALAEAEDQREEVVRLRESLQAELAKARQDAREIVERAERVAQQRQNEILEEAKAAAERQKKAAIEEIAHEKELALRTLHDEVADLVVAASAKLLRRNVTDADQRRLAEEFVREVGRAQ